MSEWKQEYGATPELHAAVNAAKPRATIWQTIRADTGERIRLINSNGISKVFVVLAFAMKQFKQSFTRPMDLNGQPHILAVARIFCRTYRSLPSANLHARGVPKYTR
jgi:hypothetical protein